jgi:hypothetical protein
MYYIVKYSIVRLYNRNRKGEGKEYRYLVDVAWHTVSTSLSLTVHRILGFTSRRISSTFITSRKLGST